MAKQIAAVDEYIAKANDFARPILVHLRHLVHAACPEVEEQMKWGMPFFVREGILCHMAVKGHCAFGFWNKALRASLKAGGETEAAMGQFGRIASLKDLPSDAAIKRLVRKAVELDRAAGNSKPARKPPAKKKHAKPAKAPADLVAALSKSPAARKTFDSLSRSCRGEYIEWITEAKRDETRQRRLATAIEWLAEGKSRNWKYERKSGSK